MRVIFKFIFLLLVFLSFCSPVIAKELKFVQISDIHYSKSLGDMDYRLLSKTEPLLKDAIAQINSLQNVDFVAVTGDIVDIPTSESVLQVMDILNTLKPSWFLVLGNHDVSPDGDIDKNRIVKILNKKNKDYNFDSTYYTFKPKKGFRVVVLDAVFNDKISPNGYINQEQLDWLDMILKKSKKDVVLVFVHFPPFPPYDLTGHELLNSDALKLVLEKYKMPMAVFSGHYHATKMKKRANIIYVSSPSLINYPNAFRVVKIKNTRKKAEFEFEFFETGLQDLQQKTKIMVLGGAKFYGRSYDREQVIVIDKK